MKQDSLSKNDIILLFDSSMNFQDVNKIIKEKKPRIITFDYDSHIKLNENKIDHITSDDFITKSEFIQFDNLELKFGFINKGSMGVEMTVMGTVSEIHGKVNNSRKLLKG